MKINRRKQLVRTCIGLMLLLMPLAALATAGGLRAPTAAARSGAEIQAVPNVAFISSSYSRSESSGSATIGVEVSAVPTQTITVQYMTLPGSASEGNDYVSTSGTLTFTAASQTTQNFTVTILDDNQDEPNESVNLVLLNPVNATLGTPSTATLFITDDDAAPTNTPASQPTATAVFRDPYEPNDDLGTAYTIGANAAATCGITLWPVGDVDYFRFQAKGGSAYEFATSNLDAGLDTTMTVFDPQGNQIGSNDDDEFGTNASRVTFSAHSDGFYYARIVNQSSADPINQRYCVAAAEIMGTPTSTPPPTATRVPGADVCEPNNAYETACVIGPGESVSLNFVPLIGEETDTDIFRMWVKPGILYTCETLNLSPVTDTNIIFASGPSREAWFAGNDDRAEGDYSSILSYLSTYTGWLYILVGPVNMPQYAETAQYTYDLSCAQSAATATPVATPTRTPAPGGGGGGGIPPTLAATATPTSDGLTGTVAATATETPRPNIIINPLPTSTPATAPQQSITLNVTLYYDSNGNFMPEITEGIMDVAVSLYDNATGQLLAFGYTNEAGSSQFGPLTTRGAVRVVVPFLNFSQVVAPGETDIFLRVAPQPLPVGIP